MPVASAVMMRALVLMAADDSQSARPRLHSHRGASTLVAVNRRSAKRWALVVAVALLAAACGSSSSDDPTEAVAAQANASDGGDTTATTSTGDAEGQEPAGTDAAPVQGEQVSAETRDEILRIARTQLDGQEFDPDTVAGRDVLLWFWAPW